MLRLLSLILLVACTTRSLAWTEYSVSFKKQKWRICTKERDGINRHLNGLCYISKQCKQRLFKKICKPLPLYCAFSDKACLTRHAYSNKVLMRKFR